MATYRTSGIIIGRTNFGEADRVIRIISPDQGKISAVARGIRKIKSRNAGHLELFGETNLMLVSGRGMDTITSAQLTYYPHTLIDSYRHLGVAFMASTMIDRLVEEDQANSSIYTILSELLHGLDAGTDLGVAELWFKLRLANELGYQPELGACVNCGSQRPEDRYVFNAERGGILDNACGGALDQAMSLDTIKYWRVLGASNLGPATRIRGGALLATHSIHQCDEFYIYHLGRAFSPGVTV